MNVLDVQNLTLSFGENKLFSDLSFDIQDKEKVGFVGVNGAGKTSLFKIITGEYKADSGNCFISKNARLGYMEQHTCSNDKTIWAELVSVYDDLIQIEIELDSINEKLKTNHSKELIDRQEYLNDEFTRNGGLTYKSMTRSALLGLGFSEDDFDKPTSKLSGGQKSKLILAKLLLSKADFLLLDEPTNHLDISAIAWLEDFLKNFNGACLIISHDRYFLDRVTDKTIELENKKMRSYKGNYSEFLVKKAAEQKAIEEKYENDMKEIERLEGIIAQQRQWNREKNIKTAESKEKVIQRIRDQLVVPDAKLQKIRFDFTPKCVSGEDVLSCDGLSKSFDGKALFRDVSFDIKRQERVFLLGDNGCGKTTLVRTLTGLIKPVSGRIALNGVPAKPRDLTRAGFLVMQDVNYQLFSDSVREELLIGLDETDAGITAQANQVMADLDLAAFAERHPMSLSGGQKQRVAIGSALMCGKDLIIFDEHTSGLDRYHMEQVGELLRQLASQGKAILVVTHDEELAAGWCDRIVNLGADDSGNNGSHVSNPDASSPSPNASTNFATTSTHERNAQ